VSTALTRPTGLTWTVLRVHRIALWLWIAYVALAAVVLLWLWGPGTSGLDLAGGCAADSMSACEATGSTATLYHRALALVDFSLSVVPLCAAVFAGGILIGRDLERGTARLAWTQSVSPARWLTAKLAVPALFLAAGTGLLALLRRAVVSAAPALSDNLWYAAGSFNVLGTTVVALPLLGLAGGALVALLQPRTLPAAGFAALFMLLLAECLGALRPHLWSTRTVVGSPEQGYRGFTGELIGEGALTSTGAHISDPLCVDNQQCLADHDIVGFYREFHPASYFWPLQLVETGIVLALAAGLTFLAFRVLKKRVAS
jgi:hypothetical protein